MIKWCKWYCFKPSDSPEAKKVCRNPNCNNKERAEQLTKQEQERRKTSQALLEEVEKHLY